VATLAHGDRGERDAVIMALIPSDWFHQLGDVPKASYLLRAGHAADRIQEARPTSKPDVDQLYGSDRSAEDWCLVMSMSKRVQARAVVVAADHTCLC
jgi:hypothetical protein